MQADIEEVSTYSVNDSKDAMIDYVIAGPSNTKTLYDIYNNSTTNELLALQFIQCYVNPILSVIGISGNMMSIAILRRSGLRKPSNILLLSLVVADSMSQLQAVNYGQILMVWGPGRKYPSVTGWQYGEDVNRFLYLSMVIMFFFENVGNYVNTLIPVVITVERLLAVFMPITFRKLVTTRTAIIMAVGPYIVWLPWNLAAHTLYRYYRVPIADGDYYSFGGWNLDPSDSMDLYDFLNGYVFQILSSWVPVALVTVGCVCIGVKILFTLRFLELDNIK
ncbi:hypothetical protein Btru_008492 [Bulinus truncatus]|nr:hypothetical protein Btru_008492 [Bulinus truncatus]